MIHQLALKDSFWRKTALIICKDKMLSDDLVNDMYLKLHDCKKEINDFYVIRTIRNLFLDHKLNVFLKIIIQSFVISK